MKKHNSFTTFCIAFISLALFVYILFIGSSLIVPFIIAILLSFIILSIAAFYKKILHIPSYLAFISSLFTICIFFYIIARIINSNIDTMIKQAPLYQEKLIRLASDFASSYNIEVNTIVEQIISFVSFSAIFTSFTSIIAGFVTNAWIILFFMLFIMLESKSFLQKIALITWGEESTFFQALKQIQADVKSYFLVKTIVSIGTGLFSWIVMYFFDIDFFIFWAFLIFLFNYIPNIGSIIAVSFPTIISLVQYESVSLTLSLLLVLGFLQVLFWNILEPKLMGNRLNLSPLVILIALIFWGTIWWPVGMLLSVPLMVIINIILAHIPSTRPIAVLLSEKWIIRYSWMTKKDEKFTLKKMKKILKKEHKK